MYKERFIEFLLRSGVLTFGNFTTKSGRKTPYFFNMGNIRTGAALREAGQFYAAAYKEHFGEGHLLYGPAYKGISLAVATGIGLSQDFGLDLPVCFNRKEIKDHGEGGIFIGQAPKAGDKIVIIEDVITAGTAIRETLELLKPIGVKIDGVIIAVDRMERGVGALSAIQEFEAHGINVYPVVNIREIMKYLHNREVDGKVYIDDAMKARMDEYLDLYGARYE